MNRPYNLIKLTVGFLIGAYWVACAPKNFSKDTEVDKCQNFAEVCITSGGMDHFDYTAKANGGLVDILFVNDNSGSMSFEQSRMAQKFTSFLSQLDNGFVDYRIGVITTDVSSAATSSTADDGVSSALYNEPREINGNGKLQDGNLIAFSNGEPFLTPNTSNKEALFSANIQRAETRRCEDFLKQYPNSQPPAAGLKANCPSGDERGIFAANLFFEKNPSSFIRPNAHLAIVILADEDVRSGLYRTTTSGSYELETKDLPTTLVEKVRGTYSNKSLSIHSIIVKPGDSSCLAAQSNQMGPSYMDPSHGVTYNPMKGTEGQKYAEATQLTNGILGDICASDYGSQLANIGSAIVERIAEITLACRNPLNFSATLTPARPAITHHIDGSTLKFSEALPPGTQVRLSYDCPSL